MNGTSLDLNLLLAFEALFAERSVTRAALRLGITQPAMSNALRRLRTLLGDPVFIRTAQGMTPTARALTLGPTIQAALDAVRGSINTTVFDPQRSTASFSIATLDYLEALYFPKLIGRLATAGAALRLRVRRLPAIYELPREQLESGAIDCALGPFPHPMTPQSGLQSQALLQEDWVCIARKGHPAFRRPLSLKAYADLKHLAITYPEAGTGKGMIDRLLAAHGLTRTCPASVPHFTTLPFHVAQTDCIATLPRQLATLFARTLPLQIATAPLRRPAAISLIWHSRTTGDPAHRWFRAIVAQAVQLDTGAL